jgi:hypothetical protein
MSTLHRSPSSSLSSAVLASLACLAAPSTEARAQTTFGDAHPVFVARCSGCHAVVGFGGFNIAYPDPVSAYTDAQAPSYYSPGQTKGYASVVRMLDGTMPMNGGCTGDPSLDAGNPLCATAPELALVQAWIANGQLPPPATTGTSFCSGYQDPTPCPCGNAGLPSAGCAHAGDPLGARLVGRGLASLAQDGLVLEATRLPNSAALFIQGDAAAGTGQGQVFGDGLMCVATNVVRLKTRTPIAGTARHPAPGDAPLSAQVQAPGGVKHYQVLFRNAASYCTPSTWNGTNGLRVIWAP